MVHAKKQVIKMNLADFHNKTESWADDEDDFPETRRVVVPTRNVEEKPFFRKTPIDTSNVTNSWRNYKPEVKLPNSPPFTAHLNNLKYDITEDDIRDFLGSDKVLQVRLVRDRDDNRSKGYGYVEFHTRNGLEYALSLSGQELIGRTVRINVAETPEISSSNLHSNKSGADRFDWSQKITLNNNDDDEEQLIQQQSHSRRQNLRKHQQEPLNDFDWSIKKNINNLEKPSRHYHKSKSNTNNNTTNNDATTLPNNTDRYKKAKELDWSIKKESPKLDEIDQRLKKSQENRKKPEITSTTATTSTTTNLPKKKSESNFEEKFNKVTIEDITDEDGWTKVKRI